MSTPGIASTPYRLADAPVLIGVTSTPDGPQPLFTEIDGHSTVVAWTDVAEARADLPDTHQLFSIEVAQLLAGLPPYAGLVIDPRSPSPVHVPAEHKQGLIEAAKPFPAGGEVTIGDPAEEPAELVAALRAAAPGLAPLRQLWRTWYQVADARPRLLVVYDVEPGADARAADLVVAAATAVDYPHPLLVLAFDDVPVEHREWLGASTPALYRRP